MKIYVGHSREFDFENELYQPLREMDLLNVEFVFPHDEDEQGNSMDMMKNYDLMVAEVSYPSTGLGVELGWAEVLAVPTVLVYKKVCKVSESLKLEFQVFLDYNDKVELKEKLKSYLLSEYKLEE